MAAASSLVHVIPPAGKCVTGNRLRWWQQQGNSERGEARDCEQLLYDNSPLTQLHVTPMLLDPDHATPINNHNHGVTQRQDNDLRKDNCTGSGTNHSKASNNQCDYAVGRVLATATAIAYEHVAQEAEKSMALSTY
ncbi:hypothetical protein EI94DRAFT_1701481 [Lactarius quietus]|nr:hypothetical protein EI94DRAFT_1701481 [Lactarius quietus]